MNKKILLFIFIIFVVSLLAIAINYNQNNQKEIITDAIIYSKETVDFDWNAKYIWIENVEKEKGLSPDSWACFRKDFDINENIDFSKATFRIAADSKYWLYINGDIVIRDGQLKRGQQINSIYYDELNVSKYLKYGNNNISILVWYFGKDGFSHVDSGQGSLLFQAQIGDLSIISDETWKAAQNTAFIRTNELNSNRLSESNIYYNANLELGNWFLTDYDDSSWNNAIVYGNYDDPKYGLLIKRDIPFFYFSELKKYNNYSNLEGTIIENDIVLEMKTDYNMQLLPYLKLEAPANLEILISNNKDFFNTDTYGKIKYITKDGIQEFESPSWINGDKIYYFIPAKTKIISLGYRQTGYYIKQEGNFECDDEKLNKLWQMSKNTLLLNMRDTYMDCPDRERALWIGDATVEMEEAMYGLDPFANQLFVKSIKTFIGWKRDGIFYTVPSSIVSEMQLPIQNLLAISSIYDYYLYTGDIEFLRYAYSNVNDYLDIWTINDNGLVSHNDKYNYKLNPWFDSAYGIDENAEENIVYYYTIKKVYEIVKVLNSEDISKYEDYLNKMSEGINKKYWDGTGYKSKDYDGYDVRVNSFAILSGLADESKYESILSIIENNYNNSTFMEKYVLEALCKMNKIEQAQNRIKARYNDMVESQDISTTLWEYWDSEQGTKSHAWSGSPLIIMSKYFAGISPLKPGYEEISIKPNFGNLNKLSCVVNTAHDRIEMHSERTDSEITMEIEIPSKTLIAVEKMSDDFNISINNKKIYKNGEFKSSKIAEFNSEDNKYVYLYINAGNYTIKSF